MFFSVWSVAIALAVAAPWIVAALQWILERRLRRRTLDAIACAGSPLGGATECVVPEATRPTAHEPRRNRMV